MDPLRLVVIGDSTAFTNDVGPQLPDEKTLYPNVVASVLERALGRPVALTVLAKPGADSRDAWRMVTKDRHVQFEVLMGAHAVIVGVGSIDHAPAGVPAWVEAVVPYLRPASLRRRARLAIRWLHPRTTRWTRSRYTHTPRAEFARFYDGLLFQVRALTHGAPGVVMGPTSHSSPYYGHAHTAHADREALQAKIARRHGFPVVASWPLVAPARDRLNPDGIHWPPDVHDAVGEALAAALLPQLRGDTPSPGIPGLGERPASE